MNRDQVKTISRIPHVLTELLLSLNSNFAEYINLCYSSWAAVLPVLKLSGMVILAVKLYLIGKHWVLQISSWLQSQGWEEQPVICRDWEMMRFSPIMTGCWLCFGKVLVRDGHEPHFDEPWACMNREAGLRTETDSMGLSPLLSVPYHFSRGAESRYKYRQAI